jgi:catechol 2,3-dioxygenase-like lactoylglutathione lyase family enzyme
MDDEPSSILSHVSIGTSDLGRALAFYDALLPVLGGRRLLEHPGAVGYGRRYPEFWVQAPFDGTGASPGNGVHVAFDAPDRAAVDAFHAAAIAAGAADDGPPGPRPDYGAPYYGCFVRDPDGNKIEATFWDAGAGGRDPIA